MVRILILSFLLTGSACYSLAQSANSKMRDAHDFFKAGKYIDAANLYKQTFDRVSKNNDDLFEAGISFYEANLLNESIQAFELLSERSLKYRKISTWYLARSYQHAQKFREALKQYKLYVKYNEKKDDPRLLFMRNEMKRCVFGIKLQKADPLAIVESIGGDINSVEDEFACVPSSNFSGRYYYSAVRHDNTGGRRNERGLFDQHGNFKSDIFYTEQKSGTFTNSNPISRLINSAQHDHVLDFASDGKILLYYQSFNEKEGRILTDTFNQDQNKLEDAAFSGPLFPEIGDHALSIFQDSIMIFSSRRNGGYGGYDLYISVLRNRKWSDAVNLGPQINTPFNEDHPFIALDGLTLYFISNNLQSVGGYDIFKTKYKPESGKWEPPENLGLPINSAGNEEYFRLSNDGLSGVFTSDRKNESKGKRDIFVAYFKDELEEQIYKSRGSLLSQCVYSGITRNSSNTQEIQIAKTIQFKDYDIEALYYRSEDFLNEPKNKRMVENIVRMMQIHPDIRIKLIGHSFEEALAPVNLYYSIKKAEQVEEFLLSKGIEKKRIKLIGTGNSFPVAKDPAIGIRAASVEKWNKRVENIVFKPDSSTARINYTKINIPDIYKNKHYNDFHSLQDKLSYSIFLGESPQVLNHGLLQKEDEIIWMQRNNEEGVFQYFLGCYKQFQDAEKVLKSFESGPYSGMMIVAFMNGDEIKRNEIIDYVLDHNDLLLYLNYINK